jgi:tetratricopeptide (TPR) repeat protein
LSDPKPTLLDQAIHLHRAGRWADAEAIYRRILAADPDNRDGLNNLGILLRIQDRLQESLEVLNRAIELHRDFPEAWNSLGISLTWANQYNEALAAFNRAASLKPDFHAVTKNVAVLYEKAGELAQAAETLQDYLRACPDDASAWDTLGILNHKLNRLDKAETACRASLALDPDNFATWNNLALSLEQQLRTDEALACLDKALDLQPSMPRLQYNRAMLLLSLGDFKQGWPAFEWRLQQPERQGAFPNSPQSVWDGTSLAGQTILLHGEQGWGDTLQFLRYLPMVAPQAGRVILYCRVELASLIKDIPEIDEIASDPLNLPDFDVRCSLLSLPYFFKTRPDTIPAPISLPHQAEVHQAGEKLKVGLVWGGSPDHNNDRHRSMVLQNLMPVLGIPGCEFHSLQVDDRRQEIGQENLAGKIIDAGAGLKYFADTARVISQLELVITVDTSVAHLAASLGKPVWIMLATPADWRWMQDRDDSPWYPTARLFRQTARGEWGDVIERVSAELQNLVSIRPGV